MVVINMNPALPDDWSLWPEEKKKKFLERIKYDWELWARPEQLPPDDDSWKIYFVASGRGFGKTRMGAEWVRRKALRNPGVRIEAIAPTYSGLRDVCFNGDSGLLNICAPGEILKYNKSLHQIDFKNGSQVQGFSAGEPEKFRGPQFHYAWMDELVAWKYPREVWDQVMFGLRLGTHPQVMVTTTPKPTELIVELINRSADPTSGLVVVKGSTFDNSANLAPAALDELRRRYEGTSLGRQELYGELLLDSSSALWTRELIETYRINEDSLPPLTRVIVAVDPSFGFHPNETLEDATALTPCTGIIVVGKDKEGHAYILEDASVLNPTPDQWAKAAVASYHKHKADKIIFERNHGGAMVEYTIRTTWQNAPLKSVHATRGKLVRSEPVAALTEQGKIHFVGNHPMLEDQLTSWDASSNWSPDRMDAFVWGVTELCLDGGFGEIWTPNPAELGWL
jgi:phage terminase large subunit-like protein